MVILKQDCSFGYIMNLVSCSFIVAQADVSNRKTSGSPYEVGFFAIFILVERIENRGFLVAHKNKPIVM